MFHSVLSEKALYKLSRHAQNKLCICLITVHKVDKIQQNLDFTGVVSSNNQRRYQSWWSLFRRLTSSLTPHSIHLQHFQQIVKEPEMTYAVISMNETGKSVRAALHIFVHTWILR